MTGRSPADAFAVLPADLPPGRLVSADGNCSCGRPDRHLPGLWISDEPRRDAASWWRRLNGRRSVTGLYPVLLDHRLDAPHAEDADEVTGADVDVTDYFTEEWEHHQRRKAEWDSAPEDDWELPEGVEPWPEDPGPPFATWPGLAAASPAADADEHAYAMAVALTEACSAHYLGLVPVARSADVPMRLGWQGANNHMLVEELSAVLRSWEDRFGARLIHFGDDLDVSVAAPPSPDQASRLALEHLLACPDNIYQDQSVVFATYAERLVGAPMWRFWWD